MATDAGGSGETFPDFAEENLRILREGLVLGLWGSEAAARTAANSRWDRPVGLALLEEGLCTPGQLRELAARLEAKHLYCARCRSFRLANDPGEPCACPECGGALSFWEIEHAAVPAPPPAPPAAEPPPAPAGPRYRPGAEIARGGLGRILAATDTVLGRKVAVKEVLPHVRSDDLVKRFLREGQVAGRLTHPHIIPVLDVGVREEGGRKIPYFAMGYVRGRDLKAILRSVEAGEGEARREFTRPRLLRIFQDVCQAMAYAHDHGVIHRDLKPANVMVGRWGEVYVVDWGLAKVKGEADPCADVLGRGLGIPSGSGSSALLTLEGEVLGTPSYMSPEQAEGRIADVDERSDIYSLGAVLYEILTLRPPFEGDDPKTVITLVLSGEMKPPSARAGEVLRGAPARGRAAAEPGTAAPSAAPGAGDPFRLDVPQELESVVLKAMAREREKRYASAQELHEEIQKFLEGEKEREWNRLRAIRRVAEGKAHVKELQEIRAALEAVEAEVAEREKAIKPHDPLESKRPAWRLREVIRRHEEKIARKFTAAQVAFHEALGFERGNREARAALADLYWDQFLVQEDLNDRTEMVHFHELVREYDDGPYARRLQGDGTLSVAASAYPCACMREGRSVAPGEFRAQGRRDTGEIEPGAAPPPQAHAPEGRGGVLGYHPFSGRALDGWKGAEGLPELEPGGPRVLKAHGPACRTEPLAGADVWLFRFEERDKLLVPVPPTGVSVGATGRSPLPGAVPAAVLDRLYDPGSPFRPSQGLYLGRTPVPPFSIPMGSYLLVIAGPRNGSPGGSPSRDPGGEGEGPPEPHASHRESREWAPVRVPVFIGRNADESLDVTLFRESEIPPGFVQVPAGRFTYKGDRENPNSGPRETRDCGDFFLAKFPITCREYGRFLNDLAARSPEEAARRIPRKTPETGSYWPMDAEGRVHLPTESWVAEAPEALRAGASRLENSPLWWDGEWPVLGISWEDAIAFAAWRSRLDGWLLSLPHEIQWEKAARGPDRRVYPWGWEADPLFCNTSHSHEGSPRPEPVDSFPADESPYGVRGLAGNSRDPCLNDPGEKHPGWRVIRGGFWSQSIALVRVTGRFGGPSSSVLYIQGGRLAMLPRTREA